MARAGLAVTALCLLTGAPAARAGLVIEVANIQTTPGTSGEFEVLLRYEGTGSPIELGGFTLDLSLEGASGITFNQAPTIATVTRPYVFVDSSVMQGLSDFSNTTFPSTSFTAADVEFNPPGFGRTLLPGDVFALARVFFVVSPIAGLGERLLTFGPLTTLDLPDPTQGGPIPFETRGGSLNLVPEPSSLSLLGLAALGLVLARRPWRGRPERAPS